MSHKPANVSMELDYEEKSIPMRLLGAWTIGLYVFLALVLAFVYFVYGNPHMNPQSELVTTRPMNQPVLRSDLKKEWATLKVEQETQLSTYGWVNKSAGTVRLPISRAMDLIIERGLPARGSSNP